MTELAPIRGSNRCLCIFARAPKLGSVKRRLARTVGERAALDAHIELVQQTLQRTSQGAEHYRVELWLAGEPDELSKPIVLDWCERIRSHVQQGADLGERMAQAFEHGLSEADSVVLIGSDCPTIDTDYVVRAFEALEAEPPADLVLGPAEDGGYGLIGLRTPLAALFTNVPWGTDRVLAVTLSRAADLCVVQLETIYDVDTLADWQRYRGVKPVG